MIVDDNMAKTRAIYVLNYVQFLHKAPPPTFSMVHLLRRLNGVDFAEAINLLGQGMSKNTLKVCAHIYLTAVIFIFFLK